MRFLGIIAALTLSGCLFGASNDDQPDSAGPFDVGGDALMSDLGGGGTADSGASDSGSISPDDVGGADATPLDDGGSPDWASPAHARRRGVVWNRTGTFQEPFVIPLRLVDLEVPQGSTVAAFDDEGQPLPVELADGAAWIRLTAFPNTGSISVYFDGNEAPMIDQEVWSDYLGVWHLSAVSDVERELDSAGAPNPLTFPNTLERDDGVVGDGLAMIDGTSGGPAMGVPTLSNAQFPAEATVEFWTRLDASQQGNQNRYFGGGQGNAITLAGYSGGPRQFQLTVAVDGVNRGAGRMGQYPGDQTQFVHMAIVLGGDTLGVYANGVRQPIPDDPDNLIGLPSGWTAADQVVSFGGIWVGGGAIDELRISPTARGTDYLIAVQESYALPIFDYQTVESR